MELRNLQMYNVIVRILNAEEMLWILLYCS